MTTTSSELTHHQNASGPTEVAHPSVAILVVNWRRLTDTTECCQSLLRIRYPNVRIYVADNASGDESAPTLRRTFPDFVVVENDRNLGFSRANNRLIEQACRDGCDYILLLNNDTIVDPGFLEPLVERAEADPRVGMVGPKIYFAASPDWIWFAGGEIDFAAEFPFRHVGENQKDAGQYDCSGTTSWLSGCCLLVRTDVIREIGSLNESFGYYCEDVDWCLRARSAGWKLCYEPRARLWHKIGRSTAGNLPVLYYNTRNVLFIIRSHLSGFAKWKCTTIALSHNLKRSCYSLEKAAVLEATLDGLLGRTGMVAEVGRARWSNTLVMLERAWRKLIRLVSLRSRGKASLPTAVDTL